MAIVFSLTSQFATEKRKLHITDHNRMKEDNLVNKNFIEKILQKEPHQEGQQKIKVGSFVMIRLFPIEKSTFKPRFDGPFQVIDIKGQKIVHNSN